MMLNALRVHGNIGGPNVISKSKRTAEILHSMLLRNAAQDPRSQSILAARGNGKKKRSTGKFMHLKKGTTATKAFMAHLRSMRK
jgi:hypothetical protein